MGLTRKKKAEEKEEEEKKEEEKKKEEKKKEEEKKEEEKEMIQMKREAEIWRLKGLQHFPTH